MFACELYLLKKHLLNLDLLCVAQNGIALELRRTTASQNCHSCQFQTNGLKGATTAKAMSFCASECKGDEVGIVISLLGMHAFIKRECLCTLYGCSSLQLMMASVPSQRKKTHQQGHPSARRGRCRTVSYKCLHLCSIAAATSSWKKREKGSRSRHDTSLPRSGLPDLTD